MKTIRNIAMAAVIAVTSTAPALAQNAVQNGDFSAGLSGWSTYGDVSVLGQTQQRAVLTTASTFDDDDGLGAGYNNNSGLTPIDFSFATNLAGVPVANLDIGGFATEGSAIRQSFTATAGDLVTVSFTWAFLSLENAANDFGFVALNDSVVKFVDSASVPLASIFTGTFGDFNNVNWNWNSNTFSYVANNTGLQSFSLGVVETGDYNLTSELRVDNISLQVSPVPEPESYAMLLAGLAGLAAALRRRKA